MKGKHVGVAAIKQRALFRKVLCVVMALALLCLMIPSGLRANAQSLSQQPQTEEFGQDVSGGGDNIEPQGTSQPDPEKAKPMSETDKQSNFENFNITWQTDGEGSISGECSDLYGYFSDNDYTFNDETSRVDDFIDVVKADPDVDDPSWDGGCTYQVNSNGVLSLSWGDWGFYLIEETITPKDLSESGKTSAWYVNGSKIEDTAEHALSDTPYVFTVKYEGGGEPDKFQANVSSTTDASFNVQDYATSEWYYNQTNFDDPNIQQLYEYGDVINTETAKFSVNNNNELLYNWEGASQVDVAGDYACRPNNPDKAQVIWKYRTSTDGTWSDWNTITPGAAAQSLENKPYQFTMTLVEENKFDVNVSSQDGVSKFDIQDYGAVETYYDKLNWDDVHIPELIESGSSVDFANSSFRVDSNNQLFYMWQDLDGAGTYAKGDYRIYPSTAHETKAVWQYQKGDQTTWTTIEPGATPQKFTNEPYKFRMSFKEAKDFKINVNSNNYFKVEYANYVEGTTDLSKDVTKKFADTNINELGTFVAADSAYQLDAWGNLYYYIVDEETSMYNEATITPESINGKKAVFYLNGEKVTNTDEIAFTDEAYNFEVRYENLLSVDVDMNDFAKAISANFDVDYTANISGTEDLSQQGVTTFNDTNFQKDFNIDFESGMCFYGVNNKGELSYLYADDTFTINMVTLTPKAIDGARAVWYVDGAPVSDYGEFQPRDYRFTLGYVYDINFKVADNIYNGHVANESGEKVDSLVVDKQGIKFVKEDNKLNFYDGDAVYASFNLVCDEENINIVVNPESLDITSSVDINISFNKMTAPANVSCDSKMIHKKFSGEYTSYSGGTAVTTPIDAISLSRDVELNTIYSVNQNTNNLDVLCETAEGTPVWAASIKAECNEGFNFQYWTVNGKQLTSGQEHEVTTTDALDVKVVYNGVDLVCSGDEGLDHYKYEYQSGKESGSGEEVLFTDAVQWGGKYSIDESGVITFIVNNPASNETSKEIITPVAKDGYTYKSFAINGETLVPGKVYEVAEGQTANLNGHVSFEAPQPTPTPGPTPESVDSANNGSQTGDTMPLVIGALLLAMISGGYIVLRKMRQHK